MEHHRSLALTGILIRGFGLVLVWGASNSLYGAIGLLLAIPTLQFLTLALQGIAAFFYERVACCNRCQRYDACTPRVALRKRICKALFFVDIIIQEQTR